ncbi:hypothetical protein Hokovirus_1_182 [Hokovirus HKV1]|uniref:IBR domain-containing protein n=1 Tax=Hokovirus HKV1 TaxID=1977638 RepID=A0A1V0SF07_9VIRU|nr:hypothetical protein Hokovirus_1_182 [Hokovirus HKV1]
MQLSSNIKIFCSFLQNMGSSMSYDQLYNIKNAKLDQIQINTLDRIFKTKNIEINFSNDIHKLVKCCPHCNYPTYGLATTKKIICDYNNGCGNDWCFDCGKKLCKNWSKNSLYNPNNNFHNNGCCKLAAKKSGEDYYENYCLCYKY